MFISIAVVAALGLLLRLYNTLVVEPRRLQSKLRKQGIDGPPPALILGNILEMKKAGHGSKTKEANDPKNPTLVLPTTHDCSTSLFPFLKKWSQLYGQVFVFSLGYIQIVLVSQPDLVREITTCTSMLELGKPSYQQFEALLGNGVVTSNGTLWKHQRKIIAPEFYSDKVKGMMNLITESAVIILNSWKGRIETGGGMTTINIARDMRSFTGDVISRACFGSDYSKGEEIFNKIRALQKATSNMTFSSAVPVTRYIPTKQNRETWALEKGLRTLILNVVEERTKSGGVENDLLQMLLEGAKNSTEQSQDGTERFVVDNCKSMYLGGYETTAVSAEWCLMLLAANQEWQGRVRDEVLQICGGRIPDYDMIRKMKQLTMVLNESLRLYPPVATISREALRDMKFGDIEVPKGVHLMCPIVALQTDPEFWGPDSYEFKPERSANGIAAACKLPHLYMPFGAGPRGCLGQFMALAELKLLIALILSDFSFTLSPDYVHSPAFHMVIEPEHGVDLVMKKL
ncbi:hypothetical protein RHMOL_Rhmol10G0058300 [Rhododendron molle]|uniref:Uncharacterized protein n=1 Tax=Rhododendron molle TaxID=49168 RepID=A0ACC0LZV8_RHOML|nr:hypothetical protein RHMOL_Rhmol10G0058300 [Rhododendron molle]